MATANIITEDKDIVTTVRRKVFKGVSLELTLEEAIKLKSLIGENAAKEASE